MTITGNAKKRHTPDIAGAPADEKNVLLPSDAPAKEDAEVAHREELHKLREQHAAELAECESANKRLQAEIDGLHADIARQAAEDSERLAKLIEERNQLSADVEHGKTRIAELNKAMVNSLNAQKEANRRIAELEERIQELQAELAAKPTADVPQMSESDDVARQHELASAKSQVETLTTELTLAKSQIEALLLERNAAFEEIDRLRSGDLGATQDEVDALKNELAKAKADVEASMAKLIEAKRLVDGANDKAAKAEAESARLYSIVTNRDGTIASLERRVQELSDKLATTNSTAVLEVELDRIKAELTKALDDKAKMEQQRNDAFHARDMAMDNARSHYENKFLEAEANLKKVYEDAAQAAVNRIETALNDQIANLTQQRDTLLAGHKLQQRKCIGYTVAVLAVLAVIAMGVMYRSWLFDAVGLGPKPVLIPATSENLQKFFMQNDPNCINGKVVPPAKDTLGIVCDHYDVRDNKCTNVTHCKIQLPSAYAQPSTYYPLTSDVLRAFNFSSTDPTCVTEPQLVSFHKVRNDGLRIGYCDSNHDPNLFIYNPTRNCYDYSNLCLVIPTYQTNENSPTPTP